MLFDCRYPCFGNFCFTVVVHILRRCTCCSLVPRRKFLLLVKLSVVKCSCVMSQKGKTWGRHAPLGRRGVLQENCRRGKVLGRRTPSTFWGWILWRMGAWTNGATKGAARTYGTTSTHGGCWWHGTGKEKCRISEQMHCNWNENRHEGITMTCYLLSLSSKTLKNNCQLLVWLKPLI